MLHAIMHVSGVPCTNVQCLHVFESEGWVAVWQIERIYINGESEPHWKLGVVTAGSQETCPHCEAKQKLPKLFDHTGAIAEVASYESSGQTAGYFCRIDCSRGKVVPITDKI